MLSKYVWDNITQENYFHNVGLEHTDLLSLENRLFETCPVACFLTGYNITEQFWLFLFNVSSGVHLRLAGQQWTGANIDWTMYINIIKKQCVLPVITTVALQYSSCTWVRCTVKEKAWVTKKPLWWKLGVNIVFTITYMYYVYLATARFEHAVCCGSLMTSYI